MQAKQHAQHLSSDKRGQAICLFDIYDKSSMLTSRLIMKGYSCSRPKHIVTVELIQVERA